MSVVSSVSRKLELCRIEEMDFWWRPLQVSPSVGCVSLAI